VQKHGFPKGAGDVILHTVLRVTHFVEVTAPDCGTPHIAATRSGGYFARRESAVSLSQLPMGCACAAGEPRHKNIGRVEKRSAVIRILIT